VKAITLAIFLTVAEVAATPNRQPHPVQMTGTQLVRDMLADPFADDFNSIRRERAMGYIDGVMDASIGLRWCPAGQPVPHELNYVVVEDMTRLTPAKLNGNAATLVLSILAHHYPCKPTGATP
jgi:hypothetical protein